MHYESITWFNFHLVPKCLIAAQAILASSKQLLGSNELYMRVVFDGDSNHSHQVLYYDKQFCEVLGDWEEYPNHITCRNISFEEIFERASNEEKANLIYLMGGE